MSNFRVGQKVVCIDSSRRGWGPWEPNARPETGGIYTVSGLLSLPDGAPSITLLEIARGVTAINCAHYGYAADRFRPLVEKKTDISIFTRMLLPSQVEA